MSFYNVTNPTSFSIVSDARKLLVQPGKLTRFPQTQYFTGAATLTAEQLVAGNIMSDTTAGGFTLTLPSATDLITLLLGPGGFDVSSSDIFSFVAYNTNVTNSNALTIAANSSGGSGSSKTLVAGSGTGGESRTVNVQIVISVSGGSTSYSYILL
jgi:hypothetical protein